MWWFGVGEAGGPGASTALHMNPKWSEAGYKQVFPKKQVPEAMARTVAASLRTHFGTCKAGAFVHEAMDWRLDLVCPKGGPLSLSIQLKNDELEGIQFRPPTGTEHDRCPTR